MARDFQPENERYDFSLTKLHAENNIDYLSKGS